MEQLLHLCIAVHAILNLYPDGNQLSLSINGTTIDATKTLLKANIANFSMNLNCSDIPKSDQPAARNVPSLPTPIISVSEGNPLYIVSNADPPYVTANFEIGGKQQSI